MCRNTFDIYFLYIMNIAINIVARVCRPMFTRIGFHTYTHCSFAQKWRQALVNMVNIICTICLYRGALTITFFRGTFVHA